MVSSECVLSKACISQKCQDPCPGTCGLDARCQVINHNPICSCPLGFNGDPFIQCIKEGMFIETLPAKRFPNIFMTCVEVTPSPPITPCIPSPCGPNAECRPVDSRAVCSCVPGMFGAPPNCRPECVINQDCPSHLACVNNKCRDPCAGSCGINAQCTVQNHRPLCSCIPGFEGDPFSGCSPVQGKCKRYDFVFASFQNIECCKDIDESTDVKIS